ncbi:MAG: stage III sporulation protein AD [Ruminococcus sp.]|nr:stage III sporulation protein AD [Ruminococcus sp.]
MDIFQTGVLCLTVCAVSAVIKDNGDIRLALTLAAVCLIFGSTAGMLLEVKELIGGLIEKTGLDSSYLRIIFKGLGICCIVQISSDCCRDSGHSALASQIELAGKLSLIVTALPLFRAVIEIIEALLV